MPDDLRQRVETERQRLGLSVRAAATKGGASNTMWAKFIQGGPLTPRVRLVVARALEWPADWPENPPEPAATVSDFTRLEQKVDRLLAAFDQELGKVKGLEEKVSLLSSRQTDSTQQLAELAERVPIFEALLGRLGTVIAELAADAGPAPVPPTRQQPQAGRSVRPPRQPS